MNFNSLLGAAGRAFKTGLNGGAGLTPGQRAANRVVRNETRLENLRKATSAGKDLQIRGGGTGLSAGLRGATSVRDMVTRATGRPSGPSRATSIARMGSNSPMSTPPPGGGTSLGSTRLAPPMGSLKR